MKTSKIVNTRHVCKGYGSSSTGVYVCCIRSEVTSSFLLAITGMYRVEFAEKSSLGALASFACHNDRHIDSLTEHDQWFLTRFQMM